MNSGDTIENSLKTAFNPEFLEVINESSKHSGHSGDDGSGASHFHIRISANAFAGKSRMERERSLRKIINDSLGFEPHAISFQFV